MATFLDLRDNPEKHHIFDKKGEYVVFLHNSSGTYTFELTAKDVHVDIFGLFTGEGTQNYHIETIQHHKAPNSFSNLFIKGVFADASKFHYQGLIRIEKEGQQTHAYQKNQNLLLSSKVFVESNPFLEILANDVFCTHGSTTGRLNKDDLFYAQSRGLSTAQTEELLVQGFIEELIDHVKEKVPAFTYSTEK